MSATERISQLSRKCSADRHHGPELADCFDEVPLWSAPFGLRLLERVALEPRCTWKSLAWLLGDAVFEVTRASEDSFRWRFANGSTLLRHYFVRLGFLQSWKSVVDPTRVDETFTLLESRQNGLAGERGELALNIPQFMVSARRA